MPYYYYFDYTYILFVLPALILALIAQGILRSRYQKYSKIHSARGLTAEQVARNILSANNVYDVGVEVMQAGSDLDNHYDPKSKVIRLSRAVYNSTSIASIGIAAHECGHAIQYQEGYAPIKLRAAIIPATNIGTRLAVPLIIVGILISWSGLIMLGILGYILLAVFQLVTLPVEYNASGRAMRVLESGHILMDDELAGAKKVLSAAALTYVAALIATLGQILRFLAIAGRRRR